MTLREEYQNILAEKIHPDWKELEMSDKWPYENRNLVIEVLEICEKAINLFSHDAYFYFSRGLANRALGKKTNALQDFMKAAELSPNDDTYHYFSGLLYGWSSPYAFKYLSKAIELNPYNSIYFYTRALLGQANDFYVSCYRGQDFDEVDDLDQALKLEPNNSTYLFLRGVCHFPLAYRSPWYAWDNNIECKTNSCFQDDHLRSAIEDFNEILRINPTFKLDGYNMYHYICNTKFYGNDFDGAVEAFAKENGLSPEAPNALKDWWLLYQRRSCIKEQKQDYKGAFADINKAIELCIIGKNKTLEPNGFAYAGDDDLEGLLDNRVRIKLLVIDNK